MITTFPMSRLLHASLCLFSAATAYADPPVVPADDMSAWGKNSGAWKVAEEVTVDEANPKRFKIAAGKGIQAGALESESRRIHLEALQPALICQCGLASARDGEFVHSVTPMDDEGANVRLPSAVACMLMAAGWREPE